jgi:hypothetical protein
LRSRQLCSYSRASQHFMEPEGSLPCSQESSTGPYPEPGQSHPCHPIALRPILICFTHLRLGLPSGLFPSGFLYAFLFSPFVPHALSISSSLTSFKLYLEKSTSYEAPHYTVFSNLPSLRFTSVQIFKTMQFYIKKKITLQY